jgi:hypothetical protein
MALRPVPFPPPYPSAGATRMMENVRGKVLGVAVLTAQAELFSVERDFCDFTNVWQEDIDVPIVAGVTTYQISPALLPPIPPAVTPTLPNGKIKRLLNFYNSTDPQKQYVGNPTMRIPGVLVLAHPPTADALMVATVAKVPVDPTDGQDMPIIDDWIMETYYDAFQNGLLGRLHLSVSKPYFNKEAGAFHWKLYNKARAEARVDVIHANLHGAQAWRFPQSFAATRPQRGV